MFIPATSYEGKTVRPIEHLPHTVGHLSCPACEHLRSRALETITGADAFERAADLFMQLRAVSSRPGAIAARYVRANTEKGYRRHTKSLALFFAGMTLEKICWFHLKAYQEVRIAGLDPFIRHRRPQDAKPRKGPGGTILPPKGPQPCPVKPQQVKQELCFLIRLKKLAGCWTAADEKFFMHLLAEENDVPRALTPDEQALWLDMSRSLPRWEVIHWYSILAFDTIASTNELRMIRLGDLNLHHRTLTFPWPSAKNKYRMRTIPLENADVLWAAERLLGRAHDLGARDPQHYLFPWHETRTDFVDPTRHMTESGLKKLWQEVREATKLFTFRQYDTRHTGATRAAERGTPVDVIVARMGHASPRMRELYTHISQAVQRSWAGGTPGGGYAPRPTWTGIERRRGIRVVNSGGD